jgi:HAD superfamily hydrolase (TIGR01459 family)
MQNASLCRPAAIPIVPSIAPLAAGREAWLTDIWGVMHDGVAPYLAAAEACTRFRATGGIVLLLSNAPRPAESVAAQLDRIGVPRSAWDRIISSGDAARALIAALDRGPLFHLGPERDLAIYGGLPLRLTSAGEAAAVVCTGLFDDETETPEDYAALLADCAHRTLPMVCANPDLTVERGGRIVYCAGALAQLYESMGGKVAYAGKPYLPIYDLAFSALSEIKGRPVPREAALAIGDGIATDIAGAAAAGVASVYVASGVHVAGGTGLDRATLDALFPDPALRPAAAMTALAW